MELNTKEVLLRLGYVRNISNLSARELSLCLGMSERYVGKLERGDITLTMDMLFRILEICEFPVERFFSDNITTYNDDEELKRLLNSLPAEKKKLLVEFLK